MNQKCKCIAQHNNTSIKHIIAVITPCVVTFFMPLDLTIAIPVKNEAVNLPGCLQAIGNDFARKVVVIDSNSTDNTSYIARAFNAEVVTFNWNGKFPKKRNWFLQQHTPTTSWVLFIDADEYITTAFKKEVTAALINTDKAGFWLSYAIYFLGRKLKGGYPLRKLALFKVGAGEYEKIDEEQWSKLDMEIHEHPVLNGEVGLIKSKIDHRDNRTTLKHYINKHKAYAEWEAARYRQALSSKAYSHFTIKQKIKYTLLKTPLVGMIYFIGSFILMGGFIDGKRGYEFTKMKMNYFNEIRKKIMAHRS